VNEIRWKDLDDVVLAGHSYGGFVITGVAERIGDRIRTLAYVEAFIPKDGQAFVDLGGSWDLDERLIPSPISTRGDYLREADRRWVDSKATAQPTATFTEKLQVTGAYLRIPKKVFVRATGSAAPLDDATKAFRSDPSWRVHELGCGHDIPVDMPDELAQILDSESP
jgi:pimeloyl-ACP methyl ester carboxylesterase